MKLCTKTVLISAAVILFAILLTDLLIFGVCLKSLTDEAIHTAYIETRSVKAEVSRLLSGTPDDVSKEELRYHFDIQRDRYTVCFKDGKEYYNSTVLTYNDLANGTFRDYLDTSYKRMTAKNNRFCVFSFSLRGFDFFHLVDFEHIYDDLTTLALWMIGVTLVIVTVSITTLALMMKRTLKPLQELSEGAKHIAGGKYGERVMIKTKDEIGRLSEDFNSMADAVEKHLREISESEKKKTLFMGNLTHELKTPLTAISGYAQTLLTAKLSEEDKNEALTYIYEESKRLDRLSKKMMRLLELDFNAELTLEEAQAEDIFEACLKTCTPIAEQKNVKIERKGNFPLLCDFDLMCTAIINLVDNAIKASDEGATVILSAEDGVISVQDNGKGITQSELTRLTEPFYMVDKSRSRRKGGAGLGLALVNSIVKNHGMTLSIESEPNVGTTVKILVNNSAETNHC